MGALRLAATYGQNELSQRPYNLRPMLKKIERFGYILTDGKGFPRYWSTVWAMLGGAGLAAATLKKQLLHIDDFYKHVELVHGRGALDDMVAELDFYRLEAALESYFVSLRNVSHVASTAGDRWRTNVKFCRDVFERLARGRTTNAGFVDLVVRLERLDRLYGQLRPPKPKKASFIRALPSSVLEELYNNVIPGAKTNPFEDIATQWRVYVVFLLLLHQGLRRGEALTLPANFIMHERTKKGIQYWLNVQPYSFADDRRYSSPSIKTASSIRQIPMSAATAESCLVYLENYRGKQSHPFFLSSAKKMPLSAEGLNYFFKVLSDSLSEDTRRVLLTRTSMESISPHDLRHTSAVIRMKQLLNKGDSMQEALQKMRSFFGWSRESSMPQLYAKAAFEERLAGVWTNEFDDRTAMLLALPE